VLYEYVASMSGSIQAQMALGHKYLFGDGVRASCEASLPYYELAANQVKRGEIRVKWFEFVMQHVVLYERNESIMFFFALYCTKLLRTTNRVRAVSLSRIL